MRYHCGVPRNKRIVFFLIVLFIIYYIKTLYQFRDPETLLEMKAERIDGDMQLDYVHIDHDSVKKFKPAKGMKYILQWTPAHQVPFVYMGHGQQGFVERRCTYTNCYVTSDREYLEDITQFDVIAFNGPELFRYLKTMFYGLNSSLVFPDIRSPRQKYVFASIESAENYPICSDEFDEYFNWTWTYRLDSDSRWGYFVIRDTPGRVIGPRKDMAWLRPEEMQPVSEELRKIFDRKTKTVAWFISNCKGSRRNEFAMRLENKLNRYGLNLDVYGRCGRLKCDRSNETQCDEMIQRDYYFFLCFENSFSEDYITEKLLHAVQYNTIPVVYSGANLSRFLPEGSYLDAKALGPRKVAKKMYELIKYPDKYAEYFKWRNHYSYHRKSESPDTDDYCGFCALLNNDELVQRTTFYENFRDWWTPSYMC